MRGCAVVSCPNYNVKTSNNVTYHRFPADEEIRKKWLEKCGRNLEFDCSRSRVCSEHFTNDDFERDLQGELLGQPLKKRLKKGVEPHLNIVAIKQEPLDPEETVEHPGLIRVERVFPLDSDDFSKAVEIQGSHNSDIRLLEREIVLSHSGQVIQDSSSSTHHVPSSLPACQNWAGNFDFQVSFIPQEKVSKGVLWTYSDVKDKLYVGKDAPCPINFSVNTVMSDDVSVRVMALYSSPENASEIVRRCVNHSMDEMRRGVFEAEHLVRCESSMATYEIDGATGRHSVKVPFENPPVGQKFSTYIYKFACFGSCAGGPNRRPLMLIFTLEKGGEVIGRRKLDVKICACPTRDRKTEEQQSMLSGSAISAKRKDPPEFENLIDSLSFAKSVTFPPPPKKSRTLPNENGFYTIAVDNYECFEFLKQMKKFYEICNIMGNLPPELKQRLMHYRNRKLDGSSV